MSAVNTNFISIALAKETSFDVLPGSPIWKTQQPNGGIKFGNTIKTVPREPIESTRQDSKGILVGLDAAVEWDEDLTGQVLSDRAEALLLSEAVNSNLHFEGISVNGTGFIIPAATASQAAKLQWVTSGAKSLVYGKGYVNSANNGLLVLTADTAAAGTAIAFSGAVVETAPNNATVDIAGIRAATGDLAITVSGSSVTLSSGNNGVTGGDRVDFTTIGIKPGQFIHVGGLLAANQFSAGYGMFRVLTVAAQTVTGDKPDTTLLTDAGAAETVDLLFGRFIRPVRVSDASDDTRYVEQYFRGELTSPNLGGAGIDEYEYARGMLLNTMAFTLPLEDKGTLTSTFACTVINDPTTSRATGASTPLAPLLIEGFGTAREIGTLRLSNLTAANTGFTNLTVTVSNNATPGKVLGTLGATSIDVGRLKVNFTGKVLFTDPAILTAINSNTTLTFDFRVKNSEACAVIDFPAITLGNGARDFPPNKKVEVNLDGTAFLDRTSVLAHSMGVSLFPVLP
jgi:hypothetical protein